MRFLVLLLALIFSPAALAQEKAQAVFAGGCFWCMESDMQHLPGVISVESGYTGGKEQNPTYRQVAMHRTGHYESVRVTFDPKKITYEQLLSEWQSLGRPWERERNALRQAGQTGLLADPFLEEFRWLLEELRVALFAQELKTPSPVSVKRLQKMWEGRVR